MKLVNQMLLLVLMLLLVACPPTPPTPPSGFNIELRFLPGFPTQAKAFVQSKALFWEQIIIGDIVDAPGITDSTDCHFTSEQIPPPYVLPPVTDVDDVVLYVGLMPTIVDPNQQEQNLSDGPGKTAAVANLCKWRLQGNNRNLPIISKIEFDPADLPNVSTPSQQLNLLADVTLHEMAHAFGFGTIWDLYLGLKLATPDGTRCGENPEFTGLNAKHEYELLGGTGNVPLTASKERGTCGHWAEGMFEDEILTPSTNPYQLNPLSRLTIASMADLGYTVSYVKADNYRLSLPEETTNYTINLVFDRDVPLEYRPYFYAAVNRWQKIITGDIPDMHGIFDPMNGDCKIDYQSKFSGIDDIKIFIDLIPEEQSDGLGGFRSRIEPCLTRVDSFLPAIGVMQYDISDFSDILPLLQNPNPSDADIAASEATLRITRDIARVLGFGVNWIKKNLISEIQAGNLCNPRSEYIGSNAVSQYQSLGGLGNIKFQYDFFNLPPNYPPTLPNGSCPGSWSNSRLYYDLMGGYGSKNISKITVGGMQDLGYVVDYSQADPFILGSLQEWGVTNTQPQLR